MLLQEMVKAKAIDPPEFVACNTMFLGITGSYAYGMSTDLSDRDIVGYCIPPKSVVFPHLAGEIDGFGTKTARFGEWIKHHTVFNGVEYDFTIFNIVKFFNLCYEGNPNMIDCLFLERDCILHTTMVAEMVREQRELFLSKLIIPKFKGYAYGQFCKLGRENYEPESKRYQLVQKYGYDTKNAAHVYRLLLEAEQLLRSGQMDIRANGELLKAVRNGAFTLKQVEQFFAEREAGLEELAANTKLPKKPNETKIKQLLVECLEHHYGSLKNITVVNQYVDTVNQIKELVNRL